MNQAPVITQAHFEAAFEQHGYHTDLLTIMNMCNQIALAEQEELENEANESINQLVDQDMQDQFITADFPEIVAMLDSLPLITGEPVSREKLLGAIGRAWCHQDNTHKVMDEGVAFAVCKEIEALSLYTHPQPLHGQDLTTGKWYAGEDIDKMVRELDVALYGEKAARQAMLCDIVQPLIKRLTAQPLQPITAEKMKELHHIEEFGLFCSFDEFEQIARTIEVEHGIYTAVIKHKGDTK